MKAKQASEDSSPETKPSLARRVLKLAPKPARTVSDGERGLPLRSFVRELNGIRKRLLRELRDAEAVIQDHPTNGNHMADDASEVFEQTKDLALKHHLEDMLEQVNHALARIEKGTFGICENCGNAILAARLRALPFVSLCFDCAAGKGRYIRT